MKIFFIIIFLLTHNLFAQNDKQKVNQDNKRSEKISNLEAVLSKEPSIYENLLSLDYIQNNVSQKILIFSSNLDHTIQSWLKDDTTTSTKEVKKSIEAEEKAYSLYSIVNLYDDFFKDETYLNTTNRSYVRLIWGAEQNKEKGFEYFNNYSASLRLPKTEEALYFFIGDDEDNIITTNNNTNNENKTTGVGIKYVLNNLDILHASVFGGFRGITNPFIKLRAQYPIAFKYFLFRPVQYIEYSNNDEFREETVLYFDYRLKDKKDLIRLSLSRYTKTYLDGMNYSAELSYLSTIKHSVGFQIYTNLEGRTQAQSTQPANTKYNITPTAGIYNYSTGMVYKQQFFKKYLFYELQPFVEFDQQYDYNANYVFRANLELYFGDI